MESSLNLLEELRLRRWGRTNYVPENMRRTDWHPIILEEMLIKDHEMGRPNPTPGMKFVPLIDHREFRIDQGHELLNTTPLINITRCSEQFVG